MTRLSRLDEPIPFQVTAKGAAYIEDCRRICATCGLVGFKMGYVHGDDVYCNEHEPETFQRDFREQQRRWDEDNEWPEFDCYWTKWETVSDYV